MAGTGSSLEKKVVSKVKAAADRVDITCDRCGKLMKPGGVVKKKLGDEEFQFCSVHCAANYNAKIRKHDDTPLWKTHAQEGPSDSGRIMVLVIVVVLVAIVIAAGYLISVALRPVPKTLYSELSVSSNDVSVLQSIPAGDNKSAIVPVRVEITNIGELESGVINVWCGAYNSTQENQMFSEFNTTDMVRVDGLGTINKIPPKGKAGSIVRAAGNLSLQPGNYTVKLRIYEDGGKRTLVYGSIVIKVDNSMVATPQPYVPEGSGRGRAITPPAEKSAMPGFEGALVLAADASVAFILRRSRK